MTAPDWSELGKKPVRDDAPAGDAIRDTPEFEALQLELRKLELAQGEQPDWRKVVDSSSELLGAKSKDLLLASWLAFGLLQRDGYRGLASGFTILRDLVDLHWDTLYPELKRMKGRTAAVEWLLERVAKEIPKRGAQPGDAEALKDARDRLMELDTLLDAKIPGGGVAVGEVRSALEEVERRAAPPEPSPSSAGPAAAAAAAPTLATVADVPAALTQARSLLRQIADILRAGEPANVLGYRLPRVASWSHLVQSPPHVDGQTQIPPPPAEVATKIEQFASQGQWAGVLEQTETRLGTAIFWLDLNRYSVQALESLGHTEAAQTIIEEMALLLRRFPELPTLRFKEGKPLADATTLAWIREKLVTAQASAEGSTATSASPGAAPAAAGAEDELADLPTVRAAAMALARQKKVGEAVRMLEERRTAARSLRARVRWRLEIARILSDRGQDEAALALFRALEEELSAARPEDWDPALCTEVAKSGFLCHQKALSSTRPIPADELQRSRDLLARLIRLDVASALTLDIKR